MENVYNVDDRLHFEVEQINGCRYFGPARHLVAVTPPTGSEVFVGKLPPDCFEEEIYYFFNSVSQVHSIRLMVKFSGHNRGYAFVLFYSEKGAENAVNLLNGVQIRKNKPVFVTKSTDHRTLVIGGLPPSVTSQEVRLVSTWHKTYLP